MTEPITTDDRVAAAAEQTARNTDTLVLIAQLWTFAAVVGIVIGLIVWVKGA